MMWNAALVLIGYAVGAGSIWALALALLFVMVEALNYRHRKDRR